MVFAGREGEAGPQVLTPFGLPTEYTLAAGLAIRGLLPENRSTNLMPPSELEKVMNNLSKGLFHRVVLGCGGSLAALILVQLILTFYVNYLQNKAEEVRLSSGFAQSELVILEKHNESMKSELVSLESDTSRSDLAMLLHDFARLVPEGVWLYKIAMTRTAKDGNLFSISGYSRDGGKIAAFVGLLDREAGMHDVRIVRSGLPVYGENMSVVGKHVPAPFTFTVSLAMAP